MSGVIADDSSHCTERISMTSVKLWLDFYEIAIL